MTLEDEQGKKMRALDVFTASIHYLKEHMFAQLQKRITGIEQTDIRWVLTVPATWDDAAKQFMTKAAEQVFIFLNSRTYIRTSVHDAE